MEADQFGRLCDFLETARLIARHLTDTTEADFRADMQKQDVVMQRIEIIGEAAAHLSDATIPEISQERINVAV
jgi:uncharacterized protein with HEPN domain